jgi:hypothetical protein
MHEIRIMMTHQVSQSNLGSKQDVEEKKKTPASAMQAYQLNQENKQSSTESAT